MRPRSNAVSYPLHGGIPTPRSAAYLLAQPRVQSQTCEVGTCSNARGAPASASSRINALVNGSARSHEVRPWPSGLQTIPSVSTFQSSRSSQSILLASVRPCPPSVNETVATGTVSPRGLPASDSSVNAPALNEWKKSHPVPKSTVCAEQINRKMSNMLEFQETLKPSRNSAKTQSGSAISRLVPHRVLAKVSGVWEKLHRKSPGQESVAQTLNHSVQAVQPLVEGQGLLPLGSQIPPSQSCSLVPTLDIRLHEGDNLNIKKVQQITGGGINRKPVADEGRSIRGGRRTEALLVGLDRGHHQDFAIQPHHSQLCTEETEAFPFPEFRPSIADCQDLNVIPSTAQTRSAESRERIRIHHNHSCHGQEIPHQGPGAHQPTPPAQEGQGPRDHLPAHRGHISHERPPDLDQSSHGNEHVSDNHGRTRVHFDVVDRQPMRAYPDGAARRNLPTDGRSVACEHASARGSSRLCQSDGSARQSRVNHRRMPALDGQDLREQMLVHHGHRVNGHTHPRQDIHHPHQPVRDPGVRFQPLQNEGVRSQRPRGPFSLEVGFEEDLNDRILSTLPVGSSTPRDAPVVVERSRFRDYHRSRRGSLPASDHMVLSYEDVDASDSSKSDSTETRSFASLDAQNPVPQETETNGEAIGDEMTQEVEDIGDFISIEIEDAQEEEEEEGDVQETAQTPPQASQTQVHTEGEIRRKAGMKKHPSPSPGALEELSSAFEHYSYFRRRGAGQELDELADQWSANSIFATEMRDQLEKCQLSTLESMSSLASGSTSHSTPRKPFASDNEHGQRTVGCLPPASRFEQIPALPHGGPSWRLHRASKNCQEK